MIQDTGFRNPNIEILNKFKSQMFKTKPANGETGQLANPNLISLRTLRLCGGLAHQ
jgi:hypothetical protein